MASQGNAQAMASQSKWRGKGSRQHKGGCKMLAVAAATISEATSTSTATFVEDTSVEAGQ